MMRGGVREPEECVYAMGGWAGALGATVAHPPAAAPRVARHRAAQPGGAKPKMHVDSSQART